jgi:hypothetical protein
MGVKSDSGIAHLTVVPTNYEADPESGTDADAGPGEDSTRPEPE